MIPGSGSPAALRRVLVELAQERGPGATFCPSEAARRLARDWRPLMPAIRAAAARLVAAGRLSCTQRGEPADPRLARGPIRLSAPVKADQPPAMTKGLTRTPSRTRSPG